MLKHLTFTLFITLGFLQGISAKTWTNQAGKTLEAEFVSIHGPKNSESVKLKLQDGREVSVPLNSLSAADQTYAQQQAEASANAKSSVIGQAIEGKLVSLQDDKVRKLDTVNSTKHYVLYFSASWCPPCRKFTPKLVEFYKNSPKAGKEFEVIFVSNDNSEKDMEAYMQEFGMTFPALQYRYAKRIKEISQHQGSGIPCLVLLDHEGKVLSHSYVDGQYVGPSVVLAEIGKL